MNDTYRELLAEYIKLKSISTSPEFQDDVHKTAHWLKDLFENNSFKVEVIEGYGNPIVIAHYEKDPNLETALIYGHYDVQPAKKEEGWESEPFELTERNGRLYARGAIDNKGQLLIHAATIIDLIKENKLAYNVKFFVEGNEETGSPMLPDFLNDNKDLLKADFAMISDGELTMGYPTVELGFRGGANTTLTLRTSTTDLHSGLYGGAVPVASHELAKLLGKLYDENNQITVPGFYDDVDEISKEVLVENEKIPFEMDEFKKLSGTKSLQTEPGVDLYSQVGLRPALIVTGLESGYYGDGYRNSVPSTAKAKINFRLVKSQDPVKTVELVREWIKESLPEYVDFEFESTDPYHGVKLNPNNKYVEKAIPIMEKAYGKTPLKKYCGGGLPIVTLFDEVLKMPQVLVPMANEDCGMHAANENFKIEDLDAGLAFSKEFFEVK